MRPTTLDNFFGQPKVVTQLDVIIRSAKSREQHLDHLLFHGQPGLGKTTLAQIIANEMNTDCIITSGQTFSRSGDLASILSSLKSHDILFIDEIHQLNLKCQELLYTAMEDNVIDILIGKGVTAKSIRLDIMPFTLIGATTKPDKLSRPLTDRFIHNFKLETYPDSEIKRLLMAKLEDLDVTLTDDALNSLVKVSKGTPRITLNLLKRLRDHFLLLPQNDFSDHDVKTILLKLGIDDFGLNSTERQLLLKLYDSNAPIGLNSLAAILNENPASIESYYEPYLLNLGLILRSHKGRLLTPKGVNYVRSNILNYE